MSIIETLKRNHYVATLAQVEQLARTVLDGAQGAATYLACLIVGCQATLGKPGRGRRRAIDKDAQIAVIDTTHGDYYSAVLRGVADASSDERENQRRATFARSAASTLRGYVKSGGDIRSLDAGTITKTALARMSKPPEPEDRLARRWNRAHNSLLRATKRLAKDNPDFAAESIEVMIEELQAMLEGLPDVGGTTTHARESTILPGQRPPVPRIGERPGAMLHSPG